MLSPPGRESVLRLSTPHSSIVTESGVCEEGVEEGYRSLSRLTSLCFVVYRISRCAPPGCSCQHESVDSRLRVSKVCGVRGGEEEVTQCDGYAEETGEWNAIERKEAPFELSGGVREATERCCSTARKEFPSLLLALFVTSIAACCCVPSHTARRIVEKGGIKQQQR